MTDRVVGVLNFYPTTPSRYIVAKFVCHDKEDKQQEAQE
jgi:hypothetical protein